MREFWPQQCGGKNTPALHVGVFQATSNGKDIDSAINSADTTVFSHWPFHHIFLDTVPHHVHSFIALVC
jgi:hypothetical protein